MKSRFCFSSLGCPDASMRELCGLAQKYGIEWVELRSLEGRTDYPAWLDANSGELASAQSCLRNHQIRVAVVASSLFLHGDLETSLPGLLAAGRTADALAAPYVRVFGGNAQTADEVRHAAALYLDAARRFSEAGIRAAIIVETHDRLVTAAAVRRLSDAMGRPVPVLWDIHHTWQAGGEDLQTTWDAIGPQVRHIHVKDSRAQPSGKLPYAYVPPGEGEFPWKQLANILAASAYEGCVSLEWEKRWHPELADLDTALRAWQSLNAVAQTIPAR